MITQDKRNALILSHIRLANFFARIKFEKTPPKVTLEELQSAAYYGLVSYASKPDVNESNFQPHARIKGAILDHLRSIGWGPRGRKSAVSIDYAFSIAA